MGETDLWVEELQAEVEVLKAKASRLEQDRDFYYDAWADLKAGIGAWKLQEESAKKSLRSENRRLKITLAELGAES